MRLVGTILSVAVITAFLVTSPGVAAAPPNFLVIVVDDQSPWDLRQYNANSTLDTPNLDRLAAEGVTLDAAYHMGSWSGAVCTPSRHMIMCGRTVWHLPRRNKKQVRHPDAPSTPEALEQSTLGAVFNRAGYHTLRTCKKGNSYPAANAQFAVRHEKTCRKAEDEDSSAWHADRVIEFLQQRGQDNDSRPFFAYLGFSHPHDPRHGREDLLAKYGSVNLNDPESVATLDPKQPSLPVNYLPKHPFDHGHLKVRDEINVPGVWDRRDEATIRNELGREYACAEWIDTQIGRVIGQLAESGELEDTYILYTSDHGIAIGRHGLQGKQNLYEHTWRVPMIVSGPGLQRGTRAAGNVYLLDILATVCDLAEVTPPASNEGLSFRGVLEGKASTIRETLYGVYCGGAKPGMRAIRNGPWKLIQYDSGQPGTQFTQLFNLDDNPYELIDEHRVATHGTLDGRAKNLADDPAFAPQLTRMKQLLKDEMQRLHDPYSLWDQ